MPQTIDLEAACKAACRYCAMGMPLESDSMHVRPFAQFMECGTDDHYGEATSFSRHRHCYESRRMEDGKHQGFFRRHYSG